MKTFLFLAMMITTLFFACQTKTQHESEESHGTATTVSLNNGEKWTANPETTQGIKNMNSLLAAFPGYPEANDCQTLKTQMETEFNAIIEQCTMTGEAHNQLHNYLIPLTGMIKSLDREDVRACTKTVDELKKHINEYGDYFM